MSHIVRGQYTTGKTGRAIFVDANGNLVTKEANDGTVNDYISRFLDTNGNGTGTKIANGDYSPAGSGQTIFFCQPASGEIFRITRMIVNIEDNAVLQAGGYGAQVSPLASGITVRTANGAIPTQDLTDGLPITSNAAWGRFCFDVLLTDFGAGNNFVSVRWTFAKGGTLIRLDGDQDDRLEVVLNDDLDFLVNHTFMIQGYVE
jgi:hypothetical protein